MVATLTSQTRIAINDDGTAVGSFTNCLDVEACTLRKLSTLSDASGLRGTRSRISERVRETRELVQGQIVLKGVSTADLDFLLPYILGAAESSDSFALGETLDDFEFAVLVDSGPQRHLYDDCKVSKATFASQQGDFLTLTLDVVGKTETESATAFPAIIPPQDAHDAPLVHSDLAVTLEGAGSRVVTDFELVIDNALEPRWANSLTPTHLLETDRIVTCRCRVPYESGSLALYDVAVAGAQAIFAYTLGNMSLTFTLAAFQIPAQGPVLPNRNGEVFLELDGHARKVGNTSELVVTNDSTA